MQNPGDGNPGKQKNISFSNESPGFGTDVLCLKNNGDGNQETVKNPGEGNPETVQNLGEGNTREAKNISFWNERPGFCRPRPQYFDMELEQDFCRPMQATGFQQGFAGPCFFVATGLCTLTKLRPAGFCSEPCFWLY